MKALLINGSPRPNGCTFTALTELANTLEAEGIETEIVHVGNKDIRGCIACRRCHSTGSNKCVFDDIVNEVAPKLAEADAFVIGAPVYFGSPAGGAISFMDRLFFSTLNIDKTMKVGASVVTCRRGGNTASYDVLNKYFTMCGMPVASSQTMRTLGRNMAFLMKSIQIGKQQIGLPEKEPAIFTNFHH